MPRHASAVGEACLEVGGGSGSTVRATEPSASKPSGGRSPVEPELVIGCVNICRPRLRKFTHLARPPAPELAEPCREVEKLRVSAQRANPDKPVFHKGFSPTTPKRSHLLAAVAHDQA